MFAPFVSVSYTDRESFISSNYSKLNPTKIIFIEGSPDGSVPAEIWANNIKYANCTTSSGLPSGSGLTEADVRDIVRSMIDIDNSGTPDWEEHTTYYMTSEGEDGAWGNW